MSTALYALVGSYFGSATGVIYCIKLAIKHMHKLIEEDPEMKKIDINVTMVASDE